MSNRATISLLSLLSAGFTVTLIVPLAAAAPPSPIGDKNLEAAIRAALHEPKAPLTDENLANVHILEADGKGIRDLAGLEKCKNLAQLKLSNNQISDLKSLRDMP